MKKFIELSSFANSAAMTLGFAATLFVGSTLSSSLARAVEEFSPAETTGTEDNSSNYSEKVSGNTSTLGYNTPFSVNYTNIFYGPSISDPSSYQPTSYGQPDVNRPVFTKNFLSASYSLTSNVAVTGTAYWQYRPVLGQRFDMMDPSARVSHAAVIQTDWGLSMYSDGRVHFGVTDASRQADMIAGLENFNYVTWEVDHSRLMFGLRMKERYNIYGRHGAGTDVELYLAPESQYRLAHNVSLTLLYEMGSSHLYGDKVSYFTNDGTDLEPGVSWDIIPSLNVNPYLNINTGGKITAASTSVGMFLNWTIL